MNNIEKIKKIEKTIKYKFKNKDLLIKSFLHSSKHKKLKKISNNHISEFERLEFLGDRVLGLVIANLIYKNFPDYSEGQMSIKLSFLVKKNFLSEIANELKIYEFIEISNNKNINLKNNKSILADTIESLIGAIFIDGGFTESIKFIKKFWFKYIKDEKMQLNDPKTMLQEISQKKSKKLPIYKLINKKGPPHSPEFTVEVNCLKLNKIKGTGPSKREAERIAAKNFLDFHKLIDEK